MKITEDHSKPEHDEQTLPAKGEAQPDATKPLTEEEQMAAFEDALKESDWGHQPC